MTTLNLLVVIPNHIINSRINQELELMVSEPESSDLITSSVLSASLEYHLKLCASLCVCEWQLHVSLV